MNNEVIERYKKYLTNAQVKELAAKAERYKLLNAQNRATAQNSIAIQRRQALRGLQNVGLAGREGKLVSGVQAARNDALERSYDAYNKQLRKVDDARTEAQAVRMVNANIAAQRKAAEEQQKLTDIERQQAEQDYFVEEAKYNARLRKQAQEQANKQLLPEDYFVEEAKYNARLRQKARAEAQKQYDRDLNQAEQDYFVDEAKYNARLKARNPEAYNAYKQAESIIEQNAAKWDAAINNGKSVAKSTDKLTQRNTTYEQGSNERTKAIDEMERALSQMSRAAVALEYPQYTQYLMMTDDQFAVSFAAAEQLYNKRMLDAAILRKDSSESMDDLTAEASNIEAQAHKEFAPWEQVRRLRENTSDIPALGSTITISDADKTKDKQYSDATQYVSENQENWHAVSWANEKEWNGQNWKTAKEKGWSASDYKGKSKYDALVNEWAYINGRTALLYTQKFNTVQSLGNIKDLFTDDVTRNKAYHWFRDECMKAFGSMDGNVGRVKEMFGYGSEREQMDAMLTLANLMTDEERARFNGMLETYGPKYADEYFEYLYNEVLPQRMVQYAQGQMAFDTRNASDRLLQSIMSVPTNILQSGQGVKHTMATRQTDPVAAQLGAQKYNMAQSMREAVGQHYGKVGNFLYQTAMSMADSATVALISGGIGNALEGVGVGAKLAGKAGSLIGGSILGASAFNSSYQEALDRGLSPEKARLTAFGNGVNEMLFESLSLDMLVGHFQKGGILKVSKKAWVNWLVNTLVQGGVEGSEEFFTDMANNLWDKKVNGIYSEELTKLREYISQGMSYDEAKRKVNAEFAEQLGMSFLGGFVSGGVMGGGASFLGMVQNRGNEKFGKDLRQNSRVMNKLRNFDFKSEYAKDILQQKNLTNADIADLFNIMQQELLGRYKSDIQKAVADGKITQEQADLLMKYEQNGVQIVKDGKVVANENGITVEQMPSVQDAITNLDNSAKIQFLDNEAMRSLVKAVGGETAAVIEQSETAEREAEKAYRQTVREINNDTTLSPELKQKRLEAAERTRQNARSEASKIADTALTNKKGIGAKLETDGNGTVKVGKGSGKVTYDFSTKDNPGHQTVDSMTATEQSALRIAKIVAASRGDVNVKVEAEFVGEHANENGYYERSTNTIHINMSGDNSVLWTLSHELTHHLANTDTEAYAALRTAIETALKDSKLTTTELEDRGFEYDLEKVDPYIAREGNLWDALVAFEREEHGYGKDAEEEVVARCCESFLGFDQFVKDFARKQYKSAKAINKFIAQMNIDMQRVSEEARQSAAQRNVWNDESPENQILRQLTEIDRIANLWRIAVNAEAKKNKASGDTKDEDIRYSIRGRNALYSEIGTLDSTKLRDKQGKENLNIAYKMDREGIDSEKIRLATGWFKGYDGKWRSEIDDSEAKLADWLVLGKAINYMEEKARKAEGDLWDRISSLEDRLKKSNKVNGSDSEQSKALRKELRQTKKQREEARDFCHRISTNRLKLSDILNHAKLYENYPQLKDVSVHLSYSDRTGGYLGSATGTTDITIVTDRNSKGEILEALMHEVQHIIQGIEGFAKGANVEYWADRNMRESADLKDAKATLAQVERDLSSVKYEGNPQASPLKTAVSYAYITDQLRKDKPGTANYAYDTEQKEKYEKRAEEGGYADLLQKYLFAYQDVKVAEMEAKDYTKAFSDYQRTAGEVEARDVASRLHMSVDERKATRPDIDRSDVTFFETDRTEDAWKNDDIRFSMKDSVKRSDAEYLDLARRYESGDKSVEAELRKVVDAAAKRAGYSIKAFHGTTENFNVFSRKQQGANHKGYLEFGAGFYFTPSETEAEQWVKRGRSGQDGKAPIVMSVYLNPMRMLSADESVPGGAKYLRTWLSQGEAEFIAARTYRFINYLIEDKGFSNVEAQETLKALGYDAIEATFKNGTEGQYVVFDPSQVKSADLITKDDSGNIIPLSERFKTENEDIRFSMKDSVKRDLNPTQQKYYDYNQKQTDVGAKLKTLKGSTIGRSSIGVGKLIGGEYYVHKDYADEIVPEETMSKAEAILNDKYPNFDYNCIKYNPETKVIAFQEAPNFDTAREPKVGDYVTVNTKEGTAKAGHSEYIWHHKWEWVRNDYSGFDVAKSWEWSKQWLSRLTEVSDGNGIARWNAQLERFSLPTEESKTRYSLKDVVPIQPNKDSKWKRGVTNADIRSIYPTFRNTDIQSNDVEDLNPDAAARKKARIELAMTRTKAGKKGNKTQVTNTIGTYVQLLDQLKKDGFKGTILDASSGLGLGTDYGIRHGLDMEDIEPFWGGDTTQYAPIYSDYSRLDKLYDAIISSAVVNVLPADDADAMVSFIGSHLKDGGSAYITVRGKSAVRGDLMSRGAIPIGDDPQFKDSDGQQLGTDGEFYVKGNANYQRGWTIDEFESYVKDVLGDGFIVERNPSTDMVDEKGNAILNAKGQPKQKKWGDVSVKVTKRSNEDIRYSLKDKVRLSTADGTRTYTLGDVTAKMYGNDVELDGGKVRQRVQMMEAIAEVNGTARVDAASEEEAEAFRRAGAEQVTEELEGHGAKYGTWEFKYEERKFTNDSRYDIKQKQKFAKSILKQVGKSSGFTQAQRVKYGAALGRLMDYLWEMQYGKMDGKVIFEFADRLFDSILNDYTALSEADEEFRSELLANMTKTKNAKGSTVYVLEVNDKQMREIKYAYENAMAYASKLSKALGVRVTVKQTENAKTLEDIFTYSTDTRIKSDTKEGDMPGELLRLAQETESRKTNPYAAESEERQALKMGMFDAAMDAAGVEKSTAQQIREAVKETRKAERTKAKTEAKKAIDSARLAERMHEGALRAKDRRISENRERALKQHATEREAKLKQGFRETTQKANETRLKRDMRTIALKWNQRLVKMLANPTEASHVPVQLAREVAELTKTITEYLDSGTERGRINLDKVIKAYQRAFDDQTTIAEAQRENPHYDPRGTVIDREMYDEYLVQMMNRMNEIVAEKSFKDLSAYEMKALLDIIRGVAHTVYDANRMIGTSERRAIWEVGDSMIHQLEDAPDVKLKGYLETSLDLRRLARIFSGSNDNAEFVKLVERLNDGAIEKERIAQVLQGIFAPVTEKYGDEIRKWYGKKAEWIDTGITQNGKKVEITKGMRVSLAMHVLNAGNMNHIANGGITIPNRDMYNKGKMTDAYANGETVQLSAEQIEEIISHMTEAEKAYVEAAKEFFHKRTGYYVNKTSLQLLGYRKATVENYFPIHTDKNFTKTDFASLQMDGSIEGQGFLKERVNASNPVYLEDITSVVNRQIRGVALYAGLAVPMRNFNAVMNSTEYFEDENGAWRPRTTVRKAMTQKMGEYGAKVVKGFLEDASEMTHVDVSPMERFAGKLATNYVKAVLLGNLKVAMKQVASYPTAAAVIPWKYLGKALLKGGRNGRMISRADVDLINQYTPLYQMRREGNANEIASIMAKRGMEQKLPWLLGWITKMDVMTVGRLWSAAEYMVADQQNLPVGSDEYYKAVAKVFNDTIQQTQPNFTPLQRNAALRSKNPIVRSLVLFGTQRMQNGNIMLEAAYELKHSKGKSKAEIKAAKMKLGRAVASQIVQNILLIVASIGVDALRGRMKGWQDDDKEITPDSLAKGMGDMFLSNFIGSFLGGSETYGLISGLFKKAMGETAYDTEFTVPALDAVETLINFAQSDVPDAVKYLLGDHTDEEKQKKAINFSYQLAKAFGYATGIPLENALKDLFKGIIPAIKDHVDYFKTGEFPQWWLHQSGKLDSANTAANYKEWTNLGKKGSTYLYWESKYNEIKGDKEQPNADTFASKLMADRDLSPEEKAMLFRMLAGDLESDGAVVYHPITVNQKLKDKERGTIAYDFTNIDRYGMSQMGDAKYNGFLKAVEMGVPEDIAATAYRNYTSAKRYETRRGVKAEDSFHDWLFRTVSDPHHRAILDMQVIGKAKSVDGSVSYKANGEVYADYSSTELFKAYLNGKKAEKTEAVANLDDTPEAKAQAFASMYEGYTAKNGIVYNDKGVVQADFTSDEAYRASQMGESHYGRYTEAVKQGMSKENAILAVEKHKEFTSDDDKDNSTQYTTWVFNTYKNAKDRAVAGAIYSSKPVTVKDGRTYDENGYIYRDYTSAAWYKLSNRTLSKDGVNKRYEAAKLLEKDGYTAEKTVAAYVELDKLSKKSEWQKWLKDNGYTNDQINIILWSRGWAKLK